MHRNRRERSLGGHSTNTLITKATAPPMLTTRTNNLIIPKVVKAIRDIDATKPGATARSSINSQNADSARSMSSDQRRLITVKKRLIPLDILTDARVN